MTIQAAFDALLAPLKGVEKTILDTTPLMKQMGAMGAVTAQDAFRLQRLGDRLWPARYPNQSSPKFNIAGALADWNSGRASPKPNRFTDRPAGIDEGQRGGLWGSISFKVLNPLEATWGSNKDYADRVQRGGVSRQQITKGAKERMKRWLFNAKGVVRKGREGYLQHVNALLHKNEHKQIVLARPFAGMTPQLEKDMSAAIQRYLERRQGVA